MGDEDPPRMETPMDGDFRGLDRPEHRPEFRPELRPQPTLAQAPYGDVPAHDVRALTAGGQVALMVLDGVTYTLRITRAGKLILTK